MGIEGDLRVKQLEKDGLVGVVFTPAEYEAVRQWVQDRSQQGEIVATPSRLYLPVHGSMTTLDEGDTLWFDPSSTSPDAFKVDRA